MFEHYLSNKNEGATVAPKSKFRELRAYLPIAYDMNPVHRRRMLQRGELSLVLDGLVLPWLQQGALILQAYKLGTETMVQNVSYSTATL